MYVYTNLQTIQTENKTDRTNRVYVRMRERERRREKRAHDCLRRKYVCVLTGKNGRIPGILALKQNATIRRKKK